jgi:hypothetical protein
VHSIPAWTLSPAVAKYRSSTPRRCRPRSTRRRSIRPAPDAPPDRSGRSPIRNRLRVCSTIPNVVSGTAPTTSSFKDPRTTVTQLAEMPLLDEVLSSSHPQRRAHGRVRSIDLPTTFASTSLLRRGRESGLRHRSEVVCAANSIAIGYVSPAMPFRSRAAASKTTITAATVLAWSRSQSRRGSGFAEPNHARPAASRSPLPAGAATRA